MSCEPWPILGCDTLAAEPDIVAAATSAAQEFLNALTGYRLGVCTYTERFQVRQAGWPCYPVLPMGNCCAIQLPHTPVQWVDTVAIDGVPLTVDSYQIVSNNRLVKVGCWPSSADCVEGRITVTYAAGIPLRPASGAAPASKYYALAGAAMGEVVREYIEAMCGRTCKLPSRFVSVNRQGVSTVALDPALFLRLGMTGLPMTDNLVRVINPNGLKRRPRVVAIDGARVH